MGDFLGPLIQLVAANENRRHVEVRGVLRLNRNINREAAAAALDHLTGVESVAFDRHQDRSWLLARDDQHMRRVTWLICLLIWDDLHALLRRTAPPWTFTGSPQECGGLNRAILRSGCGHADTELASIGDGELNLCLAALFGLALRTGDRLPCAFTPVPAIHFHSERRLYRLLVIVLRRDGDGRRAALGVNVRVWLGGQEEAAVSGERETVSRNFTVAGVGHPRFDAIGHVVFLAVDLRRNRNLQLAVGVERAGLLTLQLSAVSVIALWIVSFGIIALLICAGLVVAFGASHRPIRRGVHHPRYLRIRDRLAKVIARVDRRLDRLPLQNARSLRRHLHLVLRLLVVLHRKAGALDVALAHLH